MTNVAVNLLWCVPGDVGGSEEYLARQLLGLAVDRSSRPRSTACRPSSTPIRNSWRVPVVAARITGTDRPRPCWRRTRGWPGGRRRRRRAPRRRHRADHRQRADRADDPRPAVPDVSGVPDTGQASIPAHGDPAVDPPGKVIATPSEYVKSVVVEHFGTDPATIVVVPHGWNRISAGMPRASPICGADYGLGIGPVVVFPAITHPHKGHRFLLEVMARTWTDPDLRLVLLGGRARWPPKSIGRSSNSDSNSASSGPAACRPPTVTV